MIELVHVESHTGPRERAGRLPQCLQRKVICINSLFKRDYESYENVAYQNEQRDGSDEEDNDKQRPVLYSGILGIFTTLRNTHLAQDHNKKSMRGLNNQGVTVL
jgi:hypothetical protein